MALRSITRPPETNLHFASHVEPGQQKNHFQLRPTIRTIGLDRCLRCLLLVMCTYPFAKKALTLHLARGEGRERYFGCNLMHCKVLASSHQHLMAEAPTPGVLGFSDTAVRGTSPPPLDRMARLLQSGETAFIARARPSHHLCRASDETGPAPASITRPARRCLEAGPWWAPSRLPVVTRRLTDLASRGEQSVLSQARYCVGGPAATECRTSTEANTSSQDLNSHGCLPVNSRSSFLRIHNRVLPSHSPRVDFLTPLFLPFVAARL